MGKTFVFISKSGDKESKISGPDKDCKASQVLMEVLNKGVLPEGLKIQFASSYGAHFINRKGKNALGYHNTSNVLIVNGIADELRKTEFKDDLVMPQETKNYWAIKLHEFTPARMKKLVETCARILGFEATKKKAGKKKGKIKVEKKAVAEVA